MDLKLKGKTAVITGGSKGIGYAVAKEFLQEGANAVICSRNKKELAEAQTALSVYGDVVGIAADMTRREEAEQLAKRAFEQFGGLDCWINNVGSSYPKEAEAYTEEELLRVSRVCFFSAVYGTEAAFPYLKRNGGSIVNISSLAARCQTVGASTLYGPLKAAVRQLAISYAGEYAAYGIRVNSVLPGFTLTPAVRATIKPDYLERNVGETLLRRAALPEEIAAPVVFLCSERASYITGTDIEVSGGRSIVLNPEYSYQKKQQEGALSR